MEAPLVRSFNFHQSPYYTTEYGQAFLGDSLDLLKLVPKNSVDLIVTSPPFALVKQKEYGNESSLNYVRWFRPFAREMRRVLKPQGSLVLHLGGAWEEGQPTRSLYHFELLVDICRRWRGGRYYYLAQDFYWFNPARLPSPAQWVTIKRNRVKDAVDLILWLSPTPNPKADNRKVLWPYSKAMERLISRGTYNEGPRPSGWNISNKFAKDNGGAIPPNLLLTDIGANSLLPIANTESNSSYLRKCRSDGMNPHPARYPVSIPSFFIRFLTEENDLVLDPFGGSNATGEAAETNERRWLTIELHEPYLATSRYRFESKLKDCLS